MSGIWIVLIVAAIVAAAVIVALIVAAVIAACYHGTPARPPVYPQYPQQSETDLHGRAGENWVAEYLARCEKEGDVLFNGAVFSNAQTGWSTEIDHILVTTRGIFVIETKNWLGDVYGNDLAETWVQILGNGDIRHEHRSPVLQNEGHVRAVKKIARTDAAESMVVFVQGNTEHIESRFVYTPFTMAETIRSRPAVLTERQRDLAAQRLREKIAESITAAEHKRHMEQKYGNT